LLISSVLHSGRSASLAFASRAALSILAWNGAGAADAVGGGVRRTEPSVIAAVAIRRVAR